MWSESRARREGGGVGPRKKCRRGRKESKQEEKGSEGGRGGRNLESISYNFPSGIYMLTLGSVCLPGYCRLPSWMA